MQVYKQGQVVSSAVFVTSFLTHSVFIQCLSVVAWFGGWQDGRKGTIDFWHCVIWTGLGRFVVLLCFLAFDCFE
jgi:hypothetical protein